MSDHEHFQGAYAAGATPPWDIGRPQPALVDAETRGWVRGAVLDAGCGTGEHALFFAAAGHDVVGVDVAPAAIARAAAKVAERNLSNPPRFVVADILTETQAFGDRTYDTVVDMGFFHTLDDEERSTWRSLLARLLAPGGEDRASVGSGARRRSLQHIDRWRRCARGECIQSTYDFRQPSPLEDIP